MNLSNNNDILANVASACALRVCCVMYVWVPEKFEYPIRARIYVKNLDPYELKNFLLLVTF
jgi:predicted DNA-binding ribbon-helix-helix protein